MDTRYILARSPEKSITDRWMYLIFIIGIAVLLYFIFFRDYTEATNIAEELIPEEEMEQRYEEEMEQSYEEEDVPDVLAVTQSHRLGGIGHCQSCNSCGTSVDVGDRTVAFADRGIKMTPGPVGWDPAMDTVVYDGSDCKDPWAERNPYRRYPYTKWLDMDPVKGRSEHRRY